MDLTRETERLRAEGEGNSGSINEPRMRDGPQPEPTSRLASEWPDSSFQNLFHFGLGVLCLLVLFYGSKSFSFSVFHSQVNRFLTAVERGGTIVAGNIGIGTKISVEIAAEGLPSGAKRIAQRWVSPLGQTANGLSAEYRSGAEVIAELKKVPLAGRRSILSAGGEFSRLFSSFNLGLLKFGETGRDKTIEAWLLTGHSAGKYFGAVGDLSVATLEPVQTVGIGAIKGQQLAKSQFSASLTGISEFFLMGFKNAYSSARDTVVETNSRVVGIRSRVLANLNSWKNTMANGGSGQLAQISSSGPAQVISRAEQQNQASTVASGTTETLARSGLSYFPGVIAWIRYVMGPTLLPLAVSTYEEGISPYRQPLNYGLSQLNVLGGGWVGDVAGAWNGFFSGISGSFAQGSAREQLKKEILAEIRQEDLVTVSEGNAGSMFSGTGIVVMKPTGSTTVNIQDVKKLQQSFSDRVLVNFDQSGGTGIIQPIFRDRVGDKFLFVITPIKK